MDAGKGNRSQLVRNAYRLALFVLSNLDRPEVAKLRGSSGRDPREQSEAVKENP
nr:MAG TPA: hypothetical protein [Caudoviricetes sp.]